MARKKKLKKRSNSDRRTKERRAIPPEQHVGYNPTSPEIKLNFGRRHNLPYWHFGKWSKTDLSFWEKVENAFKRFGKASKLI